MISQPLQICFVNGRIDQFLCYNPISVWIGPLQSGIEYLKMSMRWANKDCLIKVKKSYIGCTVRLFI